MNQMRKIKFYDTSSLLKMVDVLFDEQEDFAISSITFEELENIKTSANKDADIKYAARKLLHLLDTHMDNYFVEIYQDKFIKPIVKKGLSITNDTKILSCAIELNKKYEIEFITNDLALKHIALLFFDKVDSIEEEEDESNEEN
jgi:rRNA maturation endonuclease Nob1